MGAARWDTYLTTMVTSPEETHEVSVVWGSRIGGGSPNNPYLQNRQTTRTYTDTVRPVLIYNQIVSIRETLAVEWDKDLGLIEQDNAELRRHHAEEVKNLVDDQERFQHAIRPQESGEGEGSTPLRYANYDLLKNAVTDVALRRLLLELEGEPTARNQAAWLRDFRSAETRALYKPDAGWNVARAVLLTMMDKPISLSKSLGGNPVFIDPLALAERLMELRAAIALEWRALLSEIPNDHLAFARLRLAQRIIDEPASTRQWVDSWYDRGVRLAAEVHSWYDQGRRLSSADAPTASTGRAPELSPPEGANLAVIVASWYDSGERLETPPPATEPEPTNNPQPKGGSEPVVRWSAIGGSGAWHPKRGPWPSSPPREQWEPPPDWTPPSKPAPKPVLAPDDSELVPVRVLAAQPLPPPGFVWADLEY